MTFAHFSVSSAMSLPKSGGEPAIVMPPRSARWVFIFGSARAPLTSLLSFSTISAGVFLGAPIDLAGAERAEITVEQVLRELAVLGFSDIGKVVRWRPELVYEELKDSDNPDQPARQVLQSRVLVIDASIGTDCASRACCRSHDYG
jgi:hypothetical protein